jgi:uncharacterized protein (TIGR02217 family)
MTAFHEIQLPPGISRGATGGPAHKTTIVATDAGFEQRNADWAKARGQWDIGYSIKTKADMAVIKAFHYARRGRLHGFRFKDWSDYEASLELLIASAVGGETSTQLVKTYTDAGGSYVRTIYKPIATPPSGTAFQLYKNGSPFASSLNTVTGVVTFSALSAADVLRWSGEFDTPVRFDSDDLRIRVEDDDILEVPAINVVELRLDSSGQG